MGGRAGHGGGALLGLPGRVTKRIRTTLTHSNERTLHQLKSKRDLEKVLKRKVDQV